MKKVVVIGAGGHSKVVADIIRLNGDVVLGYLDDKDKEQLPNINLLGKISDIGKMREFYFFPAVGNCGKREELMCEDVRWYTAVHPAAVVARGVEIGEGTCVMANAVVNPDANIGRGVIVNTAATIDHDCVIGSYAHIAPGVHISGETIVGERAWIGVGASVINNVSICNDCILGAGAVAVKNITEVGTYVGVPAERIK